MFGFAKKVVENPVGPKGEFMTYGHCSKCGVYNAIYLYGSYKGICFQCTMLPKSITAKIKKIIKKKEK
jgi:hypothetical protein